MPDPSDTSTRPGGHPEPPRPLPTRPLGTGGPEITTVGLGAWAIGGPWVRGWGAQDDDESVAAIHRAVHAGVNWVDTAPVYGAGHSEQVVARAVAALPADERPYVFTKCGRVSIGGALPQSIGRPDLIREECESSLRRLGVDVLDLLQLHWPPEDGTPIEETWATMAALRQEGKVRLIGVSNTSVDDLERIEAVEHVDTVQPPLSLINRRAVADVLPWCHAHGTGVIAYSPMQSGLLTGTYDRARVAALAFDDWRRRSPDFLDPALGRNLDLVERLRPIAAGLGATVAELAVAWDLAQAGVTGAIVGARSLAQVDGWVGAARLELDVDVLALIDAALAASGAGA